jgi:hypothetical protein
VGLEAVDRRALVATVMNLRDPENARNFFTTSLLLKKDSVLWSKLPIKCNEIRVSLVVF